MYLNTTSHFDRRLGSLIHNTCSHFKGQNRKCINLTQPACTWKCTSDTRGGEVQWTQVSRILRSESCVYQNLCFKDCLLKIIRPVFISSPMFTSFLVHKTYTILHHQGDDNAPMWIFRTFPRRWIVWGKWVSMLHFSTYLHASINQPMKNCGQRCLESWNVDYHSFHNPEPPTRGRYTLLLRFTSYSYFGQPAVKENSSTRTRTYMQSRVFDVEKVSCGLRSSCEYGAESSKD